MEEYKRGQEVWSKKLHTSWGYQMGIGQVVSHSPTWLMIRKARYDYHCADCDKVIHKGELHGGTMYDHYCLDCVTTENKGYTEKDNS